jgi:hypothetical protein
LLPELSDSAFDFRNFSLSLQDKVGFYFDTFIYPNGTADMGHWKDIWPDAGAGQYNCTYPDGLTDMGRLLELFADTVRLSRNTSWLSAHLPAAMRIGDYLLRARREAVAKFPPDDPRHGAPKTRKTPVVAPISCVKIDRLPR